jgi:cytochrome P450
VATRYDTARAVLEDPRFSQQPQRMPLGPSEAPPPELDADGKRSIADANLLGLDAPQHRKIRRSITSRFSVRAVRTYQEKVSSIIRDQLEHLLAQGSPVDLTEHFAEPISIRIHCLVLGIPDSHVAGFVNGFVGKSTTQEKFDFIRDMLRVKRDALAEDVLSDLLRSDLTTAEIEGIVLVLLTSGRDSVAYMIATGTVALLTNPDQAQVLRDDPDLISGAIEELMRYGTMFITLFPRTATEDIEIGGVVIREGQSVSVSPVAANRDERRFANPNEFDIRRDAFGHLGFGHGLHGCVGQQLARLELREALRQLFLGIPSLFMDHAEQLSPLPPAHPVATYQAGAVIVGWDAEAQSQRNKQQSDPDRLRQRTSLSNWRGHGLAAS